MRSIGTALVLVAALFLVVQAADDPNTITGYALGTPAGIVAGTSEGAAPHDNQPGSNDVPLDYQPGPEPTPTLGPGPVVLPGRTDGGSPPVGPKPFWEDDKLVFHGDLESPPNGIGTERMIAQDYSEDGDLYAAFVVDPGNVIRLYKSVDGGLTWTSYSSVSHSSYVLSSVELIVAEGDSDFIFLFFKSTAGNGDLHVARWDFSGNGVALPIKTDSDTLANMAAAWDLEDDYYLYVVYEHRSAGMYHSKGLRSTDFGATWAASGGGGQVVNTETPPKPDVCCGAGGNVYTVLANRSQSSTDSTSFRLKKSTNRGQSWESSIQVGTPVVRVFDGIVGATHEATQHVWLVHVRDMEPFNGSGDGVFVYYSTDNGANWSYGGDNGIGGGDTDQNERLPSIANLKVTSGQARVSYSVVVGDSVFYTGTSTANDWTTPLGINDHRHTGWYPSAVGFRKVGSSGAYFSTVMYAQAGLSDLWFDAFSFVGVEEEEPLVVGPPPAEIVAVRPNPTDRRAIIAFSLPQSGMVDLAVYDASGRRVATLARTTLPAGNHEATWNSSEAPAGVYVCRMSSGGETSTSQLVVSR